MVADTVSFVGATDHHLTMGMKRGMEVLGSRFVAPVSGLPPLRGQHSMNGPWNLGLAPQAEILRPFGA